jgi:hypothetical protein
MWPAIFSDHVVGEASGKELPVYLCELPRDRQSLSSHGEKIPGVTCS